mmetsp:Transcript_19577/g.35921  ORF Transcript_19577/g.35921 Transcript_19577/m.35921 type:complete len:125 (+) Transcript_19577:2629-3003(+)
MSNIPLSQASCDRLRTNLIKKLVNSDSPELKVAAKAKCFSYQKQGAAYGFFGVGGALAFIALKLPNYKLHPPGMFAVVMLGVLLGQGVALNHYKQQIIDEMGKIKEDPQLDAMRDEIVNHCAKY